MNESRNNSVRPNLFWNNAQFLYFIFLFSQSSSRRHSGLWMGQGPKFVSQAMKSVAQPWGVFSQLSEGFLILSLCFGAQSDLPLLQTTMILRLNLYSYPSPGYLPLIYKVAILFLAMLTTSASFYVIYKICRKLWIFSTSPGSQKTVSSLGLPSSA